MRLVEQLVPVVLTAHRSSSVVLPIACLCVCVYVFFCDVKGLLGPVCLALPFLFLVHCDVVGQIILSLPTRYLETGLELMQKNGNSMSDSSDDHVVPLIKFCCYCWA